MQEDQANKPEKNIPLLVVAGPTAVGKTALAVQLAHRLEGEIISADSMQVYRYLDIGTAKPTAAEREGIPHHLIDIVNPEERFTVYNYQELAQETIRDVFARGKLPILAGGSGLYIKAVIERFAFSRAEADSLVRKELQEEVQNEGLAKLFQWLKKVDPEAAGRIHPNDARRIIRALEYFRVTGEPISRQWDLTRKTQGPYRVHLAGLYLPRPMLYARIEQRIDAMLVAGLLDEVRGLLDVVGYSPRLKSLQSLGYRHLVQYLQGTWTWDEAISYFKQDTRKYAKRQLTWFRAEPRIQWYEVRPEKPLEPVLDAISMNVEGL